MARQALARHQRAERHPHNAFLMHKVRRSLRNLRFALEWLAQSSGRLPDAQSKFGAVADRMVALRQIDDLTHPDGEIDAYRRRLREELDDKTRRAHRMWHKLAPLLTEIAR
jgi:hypothetical protein